MIEVAQTVALAIEYILTGVMALMTALVLRAFVAIARRPDGTAVWHLAASFVVLSFGVGARMLYWAFMDQSIRQAIGKGIPNSLFGAIMIYGLYLVLRFLLLIIPDAERHKYSIWNAPWYPHGKDWRLDWVLYLLRRRKDE